jgi:conjugal transfer pilus assembly protein TraD
MPQGGSSASFTSFAWETMNKICQALLICDDNPTLLKIRHHIELGVHELLMRTIRMYTMKLPVAANPQSLVTEFDLKVKDAETRYSKMEKPRSTEETFVTQEACKFYKERLAKDYCSPEIEALISLFEHDHAHFSKMIAPLLPVLSMLTTGAMGNLLSPGREQALHTFDTKSMLEEQKIVCIGLDSLSDATVGHMVGSLLLSDLASVAGSRFNFEDPHNLKPINVFVDESAEVLNEPFIQLLNKGRGAGMRLFVATQTISDFAAKLESDALKSMILGNLNNKFALRTYDLETQKYLSEQMPKTHVKYVQRSQGMSNSQDSAFQHSSNISESLTEEETELFPQPLFGLMPNLEYIAIISGGVVMKGRIPILIGDKEKEVVKTRKLERAVARRKAYQIINEGVHDGGNDF